MDKKEYIEFCSHDNKGNYKKRASYVKKNFPNIYDDIFKWCETYNINYIDFSDALGYYITETCTQKKCGTCGVNIKLSLHHCSVKCKNLDKNVINKRQTTNLERYGSIGVLGNKDVYEKFKKTNIKNHGVSHPSKSDDVKNKKKATLQKNYGVDNPTYLPQTKEGIQRVREKEGDSIILKMKKTKLKKYGDGSSIIKKGRETLLSKYGTSNPFMIHKDTLTKSINSVRIYFSDINNKNNSIIKRNKTNLERYGGDPNNHIDIIKKKQKSIIDSIKDICTDEIIDYPERGKLSLKCQYNHIYSTSFQLLRNRIYNNHTLCTVCNPINHNFTSELENEIKDFISKYVYCESSVRNVIKGEIDIYIPSLKIGFEINGMYWHSDKYKDKNYHIDKTTRCLEKGIKLIHIWESDWINKSFIIKNRISNLIGIHDKIIYARKCVCKEIKSNMAKEFLETNHIQGFIASHKYFGLFYNNILVYCITIGKRGVIKQKDVDYELLRSCGYKNWKIIGGFSKLFKYVYNQNNGTYISYADKCWGNGDSYKHVGFEYKYDSPPSYLYWYKGIKYHRYSFNKAKLVKMGYDKLKTEFQIMDEIGADRIWDCGTAVWILKKESL